MPTLNGDEPKNIKRFRWEFNKIAKVVWSRLAPFLRNVAYINFQNYRFNIERYTLVSEYARSIVFVFPLTKDENYCIAYHITERIWVCPPSKALEHLQATINRIAKIYGWERRKIKNITINLFGNYTRNVNERRLTTIAKILCKKKELTTNVKVFVFREEDALEQSAKKIIWFLKQRFINLKRVCESKGVKVYGVVKERLDVFNYLIEGFTLLFTKKLDWVTAQRRISPA